jgi:hypothetical protein
MNLSRKAIVLGLIAWQAVLAPKAMALESRQLTADVTLIAQGVQSPPKRPSGLPSLMVVAGTSGGNSSAQWVSLHGHLVLHETIKAGSNAGFEIYPETGGQLPSQVSGTFSQCDVRFNAVNASGEAINFRDVQFHYVVNYSDGSVSSGLARHVGGAYIVPANQPQTWWATVKSIVVIAAAQPGAAVAQSGAGAPESYYLTPIENLPLLDPLRAIKFIPTPPPADLIEPDLKLLVDLGYAY